MGRLGGSVWGWAYDDMRSVRPKPYAERTEGRRMAIMSVLSKQSRRGGRGLRRDCLDHVIVISGSQLRRVIRSYVDYYHADRTHLGLEKDAPEQRPIEPRKMGEVVTIPRVGGLHHRYTHELQRAA